MTVKEPDPRFARLSSVFDSFGISTKFPNERVFRNALIILSTYGMAAAAGFLFTVIAAKLYAIEFVGIAAVLFSYANILVLVTRFGTEQSMIRFFDEERKGEILSSSVFITTIPAILLSLALFFISYYRFLDLEYLVPYFILFLIGVIVLSVSQVCGAFFLAMGKPGMYFYQNIITSGRFLLLFVFIPLGVMGIFGSLVVASGLSSVFALVLLGYFGIRLRLPDKKFISDTFHYSLINYLSDCLLTAPVFLIPIIVFRIFGESATAIYSVSYAFASIAFIVPIAVGYGLFISGCRDNNSATPLKNIISSALVLLSGLIIVFVFWGTDIVRVLGPDYSETAGLITIIMISSIFALFFQIYSAKFRISHELGKLLFLNGFFFILIMGFSYFLMKSMGLIGAAYAWIAAYAISIIALVIFLRLPRYLNPAKE